MACREGLSLAADWYVRNVILETDCKSLVGMLQSKEGLKSRLHFIDKEAQEFGNRLPAWSVNPTRREKNGAAHELAYLAKHTEHAAVWHMRCPVCIE
ncbi:hypothetical protein BAE44_0024308 [Dichanthelium oligosanthes]|uniref:RNase H type-1 domain-containing protein n=1 Tax=Dichanthelium oligosanthes TaxID=888268 RepID=A0A1E5UP87_9POAL|nr:hypothetical protein BAE44_0024308 [Dichanthelium oligosanthes]